MSASHSERAPYTRAIADCMQRMQLSNQCRHDGQASAPEHGFTSTQSCSHIGLQNGRSNVHRTCRKPFVSADRLTQTKSSFSHGRRQKEGALCEVRYGSSGGCMHHAGLAGVAQRKWLRARKKGTPRLRAQRIRQPSESSSVHVLDFPSLSWGRLDDFFFGSVYCSEDGPNDLTLHWRG